jgi:hypothetical protein
MLLVAGHFAILPLFPFPLSHPKHNVVRAQKLILRLCASRLGLSNLKYEAVVTVLVQDRNLGNSLAGKSVSVVDQQICDALSVDSSHDCLGFIVLQRKCLLLADVDDLLQYVLCRLGDDVVSPDTANRKALLLGIQTDEIGPVRRSGILLVVIGNDCAMLSEDVSAHLVLALECDPTHVFAVVWELFIMLDEARCRVRCPVVCSQHFKAVPACALHFRPG